MTISYDNKFVFDALAKLCGISIPNDAKCKCITFKEKDSFLYYQTTINGFTEVVEKSINVSNIFFGIDNDICITFTYLGRTYGVGVFDDDVNIELLY